MGKGDFPCRSRPSVAVPRAGFNPLPALYRPVLPALELCLRRRQDRRHRLPAADPAHGAVFAGRHPDPRHYGAARRSVVLAHLARCRHLRDPWRRQQRALSRPRLYRAADRIRRPRWPDRQRQSGVHRRARGGLSGRGADLAQGDGPPARHRRRRLHRLAPHVGRVPMTGTASCSRWPHWPRSSPAPSCSRCWRRRAASGSAMACRISQPASCCCRSRSRWLTSATSCRARGSWARSPSSCLAARSWPICSGFIC